MTTLSSILPPVNVSQASGTLPVANGGTGVTTSTGSGAAVRADSPILTTPNLGTPSAVTLTNATGLPVIAGTTGTLTVARGGTGATTLTGVIKGTGTSALTAGTVSLTTEVSGTLPVGSGGTGATTLTANNVLLGNGTSALQAVAPGAAGNILTSNGTTWASTTPALGGQVQLTAGGTIAAGVGVTVNASGQAIAIASTTSILNPPTVGTSVTGVAGDGFKQGLFINSAGTAGITIFRRASDGYIVAQPITVSGTTITYGTLVVLQSVAGYIDGTCAIDDIRTFVAYSDNIGRKIAAVVSNSGGTITLGSTNMYGPSGPVASWANYTQQNCVFIPSKNTAYMLLSSPTVIYGFGFFISSTSITLWSYNTVVARNTGYSGTLATDGTILVAAYWDGTSSISGAVGTINANNVDTSWSPFQTVTGTTSTQDSSNMSICYASSASRFVLSTRGLSGGSACVAVNLLTVSGTTITRATEALSADVSAPSGVVSAFDAGSGTAFRTSGLSAT